MELKPLTELGWNKLAIAFNEAFGDYALPMAMTADGLAKMQARRGYTPELSRGAFDGGRLVGFALTCRDGDRIYNSGTGVNPAHRRGGLARRLIEAVIATSPAAGYVLEVMDDNERAIALYRGLGFRETRRFDCWTYARREGADALPELAAPDLDAIAASADVAPSWQNSVAAIRRATEPFVVVGDEHGAAVVFPSTGDVPLLAVRPSARRLGHGRRLLDAAALRAERPLRMLNVDARDAGIAAFLTAVGAKPLVRQLEMVRAA